MFRYKKNCCSYELASWNVEKNTFADLTHSSEYLFEFLVSNRFILLPVVLFLLLWLHNWPFTHSHSSRIVIETFLKICSRYRDSLVNNKFRVGYYDRFILRWNLSGVGSWLVFCLNMLSIKNSFYFHLSVWYDITDFRIYFRSELRFKSHFKFCKFDKNFNGNLYAHTICLYWY